MAHRLRAFAVMLVLVVGCTQNESATPLGPATFPPDVFADTRQDTKPGDVASDSPTDVVAESATSDTAFEASDTPAIPDVEPDTRLADASDVLGDVSDCDFSRTCVGAPLPTWKLEDFQPKSAGFKKIYGLEAFKPKVTVVALLSGW